MSRMIDRSAVQRMFESMEWPDNLHIEFRSPFYRYFMNRRVVNQDVSPQSIINGYGSWWRFWDKEPSEDETKLISWDPIPDDDLMTLMLLEKLRG